MSWTTGPRRPLDGTDGSSLDRSVTGASAEELEGLITYVADRPGHDQRYAINPARDLSPRIVHALLPIAGKRDSDWGYAWIPIIGPILGGALAAVLFRGLS